MAVPAGTTRIGAELTPDSDGTPADRRTTADGPDRPTLGRSRAVSTLYPFLLAIFPVLSVAAGKAGTYSVSDLARIVCVLLACVAVALAVGAGVARALRRDEPLARGALLAAIAVVWLLYYMPIEAAVIGLWRPLGRAAVLGSALIVISAALAWLALRPRWTLGGIGKFATLAGTLLVGNATAHVVVENGRSRARIERSAMWKLVHEPFAVRPAFARPGPKRDIYLILLDGYPNGEVLRQRFGYDNAAFLDSLRTLGFTIPRRVRSNYPSTMLSLTSMLNFEHDTLLARDLAPNDLDHTFPTALIQENRAARFLRGQGYQYVLFPTFWFEPTRRSPIADRTFTATRLRSPLLAALLRGELRRTTLRSTFLVKFAYFRRNYDAEYMLQQFASLHDVPDDPNPTFTFAHFLLPHQPIVLDGACRPINARGTVVGERMANAGPRDAFLGAVRCGNRQVLSVVADLLRRSETPPIIIVVGDHGTLSHGWASDAKVPIDSVAAERLGALGAFYMPDGGGALFADSSTHVNIFRHVFRYYFGADLQPISNEAFFTQAGEAYRFQPVNERVVVGG